MRVIHGVILQVQKNEWFMLPFYFSICKDLMTKAFNESLLRVINWKSCILKYFGKIKGHLGRQRTGDINSMSKCPFLIQPRACLGMTKRGLGLIKSHFFWFLWKLILLWFDKEPIQWSLLNQTRISMYLKASQNYLVLILV